MDKTFAEVVKFTKKPFVIEELWEAYFKSFVSKQKIKWDTTEAYAIVVGENDDPTLVLHDTHFTARVLERSSHVDFLVVQKLVELFESNALLADAILDAENDAFERSKPIATVAFHWVKHDWFFYLKVADGVVYIATFISAPVYYIGKDSDRIISLDSRENVVLGIENNPRLKWRGK